MVAATRLALSWLTVLPVPGPPAVDRAVAGRAIALAPVVGALLGAAATGLLWVLCWAGTGFTLAALVTVGALALATRGMHLDGLADTADGLGSYGSPERAREVMKSGGAGPFGVAALIFAIGIQALAFAAAAEAGRWLAVGLAVAAGRVAVVVACRGHRPAPGAGFGALVARTQPWWTVLGWVVLALGTSVFAACRLWQGPVAVGVALLGSVLLVRHCVRRFDGLGGDVLGAALELTVAVAAAIVSAV
ncbi:MAG: adenosylcobinamide-GDP ribazoletransferase [Nocardia sp.]|nr:adenosylcobinamide-GDP ribazoletransferase [Nocardia sp.]